MYMGYFKRKRTNKKKGKRGTKKYRGGAGTNATNVEMKNAQTSLPPELEEKITKFKDEIGQFIISNPAGKELIINKLNEIKNNSI